MKSSRERMRKDEMQLTMSRIPLAIESNRLFPSAATEENQTGLDKIKKERKKASKRGVDPVSAAGYLGRGR